MQPVNHMSWVNAQGVVGYLWVSYDWRDDKMIDNNLGYILYRFQVTESRQLIAAAVEPSKEIRLFSPCHRHTFRVTGPLWVESTDDQWVLHTKRQ